MKTSVAIVLTIILSMAVASPTFFEPKNTRYIIHIPYHVKKVPVYIKEPVYKPVIVYKSTEHHYNKYYHHDDHHHGHYDHYYDHWY